MEHYAYRDNVLRCEEVDLHDIVREVGTPVYVYSRRSVREHCEWFERSLRDVPHLSCYAVKANAGRPVLREIAQAGLGADVGSAGELKLALAAGFDPGGITFSGVGKTEEEIGLALRERIHSLNVESAEELRTVDATARRSGGRARVLLRVNLDMETPTHPHISTGSRRTKFGLPVRAVREILASPGEYRSVDFIGLHSHIGSQITDPASLREATRRLLALFTELRGLRPSLELLNIGGGFGVQYRNYLSHPLLAEDPDTSERGLTTSGLLEEIIPVLRGAGVSVLLQPGRSIVAHSGILLAKVLYKKQNERIFIIVDAGMNDLIRPSLYGAYHQIVPLRIAAGPKETVDIVGPLCESADILGEQRLMRVPGPGDVLAVLCAGAYGFVLASNYLMRPRPAEVLVDGAGFTLFRRRETVGEDA